MSEQHEVHNSDQIRSKLIQIFRYIQAFNNIQNPTISNIQSQPWVLWFHNLPHHASIQPGFQIDYSSHKNSQQVTRTAFTDQDDSFILKVRRPQLTTPPSPPREVASLLQDDWKSTLGTITVKPEHENILRQDSPLFSLFTRWQEQWRIWAEEERPALQADQLYQQLYELYTKLQRESERLELVVGDGIFSQSVNANETMYHPVLLSQVQLQFDPQIPEFTVTETEQPPELYTALLQAIPGINAGSIGQSRQDFEQNHWHPLGDEDTTQFFKRLINQISPKGTFLEDPSAQIDNPYPSISRNPVLFLRNQSLGFSTAIESILSALPTSDHLPFVLANLTGIEHPISEASKQHRTNSILASPNGEDEEVLLSKEANAEQLEIARRLEQHDAVLVQGPPGTGKTHTIANLLGHFLAQGKSVLVTSHTSKALRVLREKVVEPLQPLCVSMLEDDNRQHMERTIDAITEQLSSINEHRLHLEAENLSKQRIELIRSLRNTREELKKARGSEYEDIIIAGQQYPPAMVAREIAANKDHASWIPEPIVAGAPLPLSRDEIYELYRTNITVTHQDERDSVPGLPVPNELLSPIELSHIFTQQKQLQQAGITYGQEFWKTPSPASPSEIFTQIQEQLTQALDFLKDQSPWKLEAISAGREGGLRQQLWDDLIAQIESVYHLSLEVQTKMMKFELFLPEELFSSKGITILGEMIKHFEKGKNLNSFTLLMHPDWKIVVNGAQINGQPPKVKEHFTALHELATLRIARAELVGRWHRQVTALGGPEISTLGSDPERQCMHFIYPLGKCLKWYHDSWEPLENQLKQQGLRWEKLLAEIPSSSGTHADLQQLNPAVLTYLLPILETEDRRRSFATYETKLLALAQKIENVHASATKSDIVVRLRIALATRDPQQYKEAFERLVEIQEQQQEQNYRYTLLSKLEKSAPGWTAAICNRQGAHGAGQPPGDPEEAWRWRQLQHELDKRAQVSLEALQERIVRLSGELHSVTAELIEKKAWAAQAQRTTLEQRQALQGWKGLMRKIGKGTGKRAARYLAAARRLMPICQTAVPVWIMPLSRVVQSFNPSHNSFDIVIIDEASQADIKALIALYMGKQIIVVGDDKQVTPLGIGQNIDTIDNLVIEHLQGIPNASNYNEKLSVYELTSLNYPPVCLKEHFRCVSPIIQFSNILSYDGNIKPLRDDSEVLRRPPTIAYRVHGTKTTRDVNKEEAQTIASLLVAATEQQEYQDATFGVISMVGQGEQAFLIDGLLRRYLSETAYVKHRILCGTSAQFQGDERDVIFLSMVDTPQEGGPLRMRSEDASEDRDKKRFNVAASRARDQLWVVHSLDPLKDLKEGDIRKKLILHAQNPTTLSRASAEQEKNRQGKDDVGEAAAQRTSSELRNCCRLWRKRKRLRSSP